MNPADGDTSVLGSVPTTPFYFSRMTELGGMGCLTTQQCRECGCRAHGDHWLLVSCWTQGRPRREKSSRLPRFFLNNQTLICLHTALAWRLEPFSALYRTLVTFEPACKKMLVMWCLRAGAVAQRFRAWTLTEALRSVPSTPRSCVHI